MFHKCSEKCLCAGGGQQGGKETVLYCYGEVSQSVILAKMIDSINF